MNEDLLFEFRRTEGLRDMIMQHPDLPILVMVHTADGYECGTPESVDAEVGEVAAYDDSYWTDRTDLENEIQDNREFNSETGCYEDPIDLPPFEPCIVVNVTF